VALPDLGDERGLRAGLVEDLRQRGKVHVPLADLQPFAIDALGIDDMEVCGIAPDLAAEFAHRPAEVVARQLRVRKIEAHAHVVGHAEGDDLVGVHEQVVVALPAEMPREGRHRLGNDLHPALSSRDRLSTMRS
jgi:hypothetical protein